jgi:hypothetical protein
MSIELIEEILKENKRKWPIKITYQLPLKLNKL